MKIILITIFSIGLTATAAPTHAQNTNLPALTNSATIEVTTPEGTNAEAQQTPEDLAKIAEKKNKASQVITALVNNLSEKEERVAGNQKLSEDAQSSLLSSIHEIRNFLQSQQTLIAGAQNEREIDAAVSQITQFLQARKPQISQRQEKIDRRKTAAISETRSHATTFVGKLRAVTTVLQTSGIDITAISAEIDSLEQEINQYIEDEQVNRATLRDTIAQHSTTIVSLLRESFVAAQTGQ